MKNLIIILLVLGSTSAFAQATLVKNEPNVVAAVWYESNLRDLDCTIYSNGKLERYYYRGNSYERSKLKNGKEWVDQVPEEQMLRLNTLSEAVRNGSQTLEGNNDVNTHGSHYFVSIYSGISDYAGTWIETANTDTAQWFAEPAAKELANLITNVCKVGHARTVWMNGKGSRYNP
jgi:hypothetical protein